jgi:hypothetical protein
MGWGLKNSYIIGLALTSVIPNPRLGPNRVSPGHQSIIPVTVQNSTWLPGCATGQESCTSPESHQVKIRLSAIYGREYFEKNCHIGGLALNAWNIMLLGSR